MPRNTATGLLIGLASIPFGFALVWHIWWLAVVTLIGMIGLAILHTFNEDRDYYVQPDEIKAIEDARFAKLNTTTEA